MTNPNPITSVIHTRKDELASCYEWEHCSDSTRILSPGKFEGEPLYVPYFYDAFLDGFAEFEGDEDDEYMTFDITDEDVELWPELKGWSRILLFERSDGFVSHQVIK